MIFSSQRAAVLLLLLGGVTISFAQDDTINQMVPVETNDTLEDSNQKEMMANETENETQESGPQNVEYVADDRALNQFFAPRDVEEMMSNSVDKNQLHHKSNIAFSNDQNFKEFQDENKQRKRERNYHQQVWHQSDHQYCSKPSHRVFWHRETYLPYHPWNLHQPSRPLYRYKYHAFDPLPHDGIRKPHPGHGLGYIYHIIHKIAIDPNAKDVSGHDKKDGHKNQLHGNKNEQSGMKAHLDPTPENIDESEVNITQSSVNKTATAMDNMNKDGENGDKIMKMEFDKRPIHHGNNGNSNDKVIGIIHSIYGYKHGDPHALPFIPNKKFIPFYEFPNETPKTIPDIEQDQGPRHQIKGTKHTHRQPLQFDDALNLHYPDRSNNFRQVSYIPRPKHFYSQLFTNRRYPPFQNTRQRFKKNFLTYKIPRIHQQYENREHDFNNRNAHNNPGYLF